MEDSTEYGSDFVTIIDDNGDEFELEHIDTMELDGSTYMMFLPADMDEEDPDYGYVMLKVVETDGGEEFESIDDEDEENRVYEGFMERLFDE